METGDKNNIGRDEDNTNSAKRDITGAESNIGGDENNINGAESGHLSRRERRLLQLREEILSAATTMFARHGYEGTSMQQIADEAEISVGSLYMHFEGKEAIYKKIVEFHMTRFHDLGDRACLPGMTHLEKIRARIQAAVDYFVEQEDFLRFYWDRDPGCRDEMCNKADDNHTDIIRLHIEDAIRDGELDIGIDTFHFATMMEGAANHFVETLVARGEGFEILPELLDRIFLRPFETKNKMAPPDEESR
ncbi:MAG: TetR/AcrR family transcriptional regulator [Candidatus Krumholzibacteria bacterium]|nr:TetR/AcrR family transcriptional regulator [Candidatus Krumholzibacteria bacterium]